MPSLPAVPEGVEGTPGNYSPLCDAPALPSVRPQTDGLVAARVRRFEAGVLPPSEPKSQCNKSSDVQGVTKQGKKVLLDKFVNFK